jgi:PAS domain S-box-containing protein
MGYLKPPTTSSTERLQHPHRILLLEDDAADAELAERTLRRSGLEFTFLQVATREVFEQALRDYDPDIILVDFQVPGFNGQEAVKLVKERREDLPVILVTGFLSDEAAGQFIKLGISDYVLKDRLARLPAAVTGALSEAEEVRARLHAEASRDALARILECAQDGVIGTDNSGTVIAWNASATRLYQRTAAEAIGLPIRTALGQFYGTQIETALRRIERDGTVAALEMQCGTGPGLTLSLVLSPIRDSKGDLTGTSLIIRDITSERKLQRQLRETTAQLVLVLNDISQSNVALQREIQVRRSAEAEAARARQEAERANRAKTSYLSEVSHEIRTPMTCIIGFADLLMDAKLPDEQARKVRYIREAAKSLLDIVNDLIDISIVESSGIRVVSEPTNLHTIVESVLAIVKPSAEVKQLTLNCTIEPDVPDWVSTDPKRLRQVLLNLVSNAIKFTSQGAITVSVRTETGGDGSLVRFSVTDTGIGIPREKQQQLFTEFYRVGQIGAREQEGSGLGLAISKRLVEVMGGTIGVASQPQLGSTFWFRLPLPAAQAKSLPTDASAHAHTRHGHILVAEDLPMNQLVITEMLEGLGHKVTVAGDGMQAIAEMRTNSFDLVLMDMEMPVMGGLDATRIARSMEQTKATPIVALTANAMPSQIAACQEAGMDDHLPKPIDREQLTQVLDKWIGQQSPAAAQDGELPDRVPVSSPLDDLEARFGPDKARRFAGMAREHMNRMMQHLPDCQDAAAAAQCAHDMVSVAGNIGMLPLSEQSRRLMVALQADPAGVLLAAKVLQAALQVAILELDVRYPP